MKKIVLLCALLVGAYTNTKAQSLNFDGSDDYVEVGNILTPSYTKEAWIYMTANSGSNNVISGGSAGEHAFWVPGQTLSAGHNGAWSTVQDGTTLNLNQWYHIAVTYDAIAQIMTLYKNGVQVDQASGVAGYNGGNLVLLGSYDYANLFNGNIDEVHIYNTVLTATQIQNEMNCSFATAQTGLIASFSFNEGLANGTNTALITVTDASGNGNNGALNNFALTGNSSNFVGNAPSVIAISGITGINTICSGSTTTLTANTNATTYTWSANAGSVNTTTVSVSPNATDIYTVTVTDGVCMAMDTISVIVTVTPTVSVTGNVAICSGATTTLTASGAATYTWSANAGGVNTASVSGILNNTKTFTVTGANGSCKDSTTVMVNVTPMPNIHINSATSICLGDNNTLTATGAAANYLWSANAGSATTTTATPTTNSTDTYTVIGSNSAACADTATITVTVNIPPTVTVTSGNMCAGSTTTLTATSPTAASYLWNTGETTATIYSGSTSTTNYTVTAIDVNNCMSSITTTVTVNPIPIISVNSPVICIGSTATLTAGGTASTFTWSTSENGISITPSPTITTNYTVTGADGNGCESMATTTIVVNGLPTVSVNSTTACVNSAATLTASGANTYTWSTTELGAMITPSATTTTNYTVVGSDGNGCANSAVATVTVIALPVITISGNSTSVVCAGTTTTLTASGANTYSWSTTALSASIVVTPTVTSNYTVTGRDNSTTCTNMAVVTVTVNPLPNNAVVISGNTLTAANAVATYQWIDCGTHSLISSETNQNFTPTVTGSYQVKLTENGCTDTSTCKLVTVTGINAFTNNQVIGLYPNPATDAFYIQTNTTFDNATVEVYDMIGQKVLAEKIESNLTRLSLNNLNNAVYQVRIINNNTLIYQSKIVKQQ